MQITTLTTHTTNSHWYKLTIGLIHSIAPNPFVYTYI